MLWSKYLLLRVICVHVSSLTHSLLTLVLQHCRLHAMHLKSAGAIVARTLSYEACEFELIENVSDDSVRKIYNDAANLWSK